MGRTKGTRNHAGHKAGGARKGAGRKRKSMTDSDMAADLEEGDQEQNMAIASPSPLPRDHFDEDQVCPILKPRVNLRHQIPLAMTPRIGNLQSSYPLPRLRLCPPTWTSATTEPESAVPVVATSFLRSTAYSLSSPVQLPTELSHRPFSPSVSHRHSSSNGHSPEFSQAPSDERLSDSDERIVEDESSVPSPALSYAEVEHQFGPSDGRHHSMTRASTPDSSDSSSPEPSPPPSPSRAAMSRATLVNIAPAPLSQQQQGTWVVPYPLPTMMSSSSIPHLIVSQVSLNKRRRRRCAVCMQLGKEETSYDCPGRGDRARCASMQRKIRANLAKARGGQEKTREEPSQSDGHKDREPEHVPGSLSSPNPAPVFQSEPSSSQTAAQPGFVPTLPTHIPPGYVAFVPYGPPVRLVLSSGENTKRRARRCMVCVTLGREGTQCPGRGSRVLCPDYDLADNLPAIRRWEPIVDEGDE